MAFKTPWVFFVCGLQIVVFMAQGQPPCPIIVPPNAAADVSLQTLEEQLLQLARRGNFAAFAQLAGIPQITGVPTLSGVPIADLIKEEIERTRKRLFRSMRRSTTRDLIRRIETLTRISKTLAPVSVTETQPEEDSLPQIPPHGRRAARSAARSVDEGGVTTCTTTTTKTLLRQHNERHQRDFLRVRVLRKSSARFSGQATQCDQEVTLSEEPQHAVRLVLEINQLARPGNRLDIIKRLDLLKKLPQNVVQEALIKTADNNGTLLH
ncbi:MAG TPA: hypothetical protein PLV25_00855, partial [Opitutales bacterium]|nr:hypothetical protein [Opitutales bacterium]